ncbi:endoplasmic reticulum resident protein 27-like [Acipenser ruthenus]|uniref:endoplasmic reticulum resident protein 27-like n=1 Tax=Acipenser ruthenus TaxID=7906 RepID=UPI0027412B20|nr:endoplasmic reticulum resident protein 27-like [Acipenser ruthenus]
MRDFVLKCVFVVLLLNSPTVITEDGGPDSTPSWLKDVTAVDQFLEEPDVAVIGFFKDSEALGFTDFVTVSSDLSPLTFALCSDPATWEKYHINTSTVSVFRKTDSRHEALELREDRKVDSDTMARFIRINELHYLTEYSDVTAIGIFQSAVSTHLLLFTDQRSKNCTALQRNIRELAPEYRGKVLFVLVDVSLVSNARVLRYFGLESRDTPAVGLYSTENDRKWLLPEGEVTSERVREFCDSALRGELKTEDPKTEGKEAKSEL